MRLKALLVFTSSKRREVVLSRVDHGVPFWITCPSTVKKRSNKYLTELRNLDPAEGRTNELFRGRLRNHLRMFLIFYFEVLNIKIGRWIEKTSDDDTSSTPPVSQMVRLNPYSITRKSRRQRSNPSQELENERHGENTKQGGEDIAEGIPGRSSERISKRGNRQLLDHIQE